MHHDPNICFVSPVSAVRLYRINLELESFIPVSRHLRRVSSHDHAHVKLSCEAFQLLNRKSHILRKAQVFRPRVMQLVPRIAEQNMRIDHGHFADVAKPSPASANHHR